MFKSFSYRTIVLLFSASCTHLKPRAVSSTSGEGYLGYCSGTGSFKGARAEHVSLKPGDQYQRVLMEDEKFKVQVSLDTANSDSTHYLGLEIYEFKDGRTISTKMIKGSVKDMVQYLELPSNSSVSCLPMSK